MSDNSRMAQRHIGAAVAAIVKQTSISDPAVLTGVWAVDYLSHVARRDMRARVGLARDAGHTWAEIGRVLKLRPEDRALGEAAFEYVLGPPVPGSWERALSWRCTACGRSVQDVGPYNGHPADCDLGHAGDCRRLAADVAAWRDGLDEDEGGS